MKVSQHSVFARFVSNSLKKCNFKRTQVAEGLHCNAMNWTAQNAFQSKLLNVRRKVAMQRTAHGAFQKGHPTEGAQR